MVTSLPEFDRETKLILRCLAVCEVQHCLGDFFALDFTYTSPCSPTKEYSSLFAHPGVVRVTTEEGQSACGDRPHALVGLDETTSGGSGLRRRL